MIDLHLHSTYSDGNKTLEELIKLCKEKNIKSISFTDHNTIKSAKEIEKLSKDNNIEIINGIELYPLKEGVHGFHLLVYDYKITENLLKLMDELIQNRYNSTKEKIELLKNEFNIDINIDELPDIWLSNHSIRLYLNDKYGKEESDKIMEFLNSHNIKTKKKIEYKKLLDIIKEAEGIPILAHPKSVKCDDFDEFLTDLMLKGLKGMEVYHSSHSPYDVKKYLEYAKKFDLLISAGSDYHGYNKKDYNGKDVEVGEYYGNNDNSVNIIEYIKRRKNVKT